MLLVEEVLSEISIPTQPNPYLQKHLNQSVEACKYVAVYGEVDHGRPRRRWTTMDNNGQQWTKMDKNGQQSEVLHASVMTFLGTSCK